MLKKIDSFIKTFKIQSTSVEKELMILKELVLKLKATLWFQIVDTFIGKLQVQKILEPKDTGNCLNDFEVMNERTASLFMQCYKFHLSLRLN